MADADVILLVDDSPDDVWAFRRAYKHLALHNPLAVLNSGSEAISYFKGEGKYANRAEYPLPALLILDLKMPGVDGFDVLEWVRAQPELSSLRIVVLTSSDEIRDIDRAYKLGGNSFLTKPLHFPDLRDLLFSIQVHWLQQSKAPTVSRSASGQIRTPSVDAGSSAN